MKKRFFFKAFRVKKEFKIFSAVILAISAVCLSFGAITNARETSANVSECKKTVCLTFDDGPSKRTMEILDILDKHDIKACFFVIGASQEKGQEIIKEIKSRGHLVAAHSFSHKYEEIYSSVDAYMKDFDNICCYIEEATGEMPTLFRFPGGSKNSLGMKNGIMDEIKKRTCEKGFDFLDWNIVSGDDTATVYPPETLLENIKRDAKKAKDPLVILFHDTYHNKTTPQAVELCIEYFKNNNYEFKRANEIEKMVQFK